MFALISIICIAIVIFIEKHLYMRNWESGFEEKVRTRVWQWIILMLLCLIPIANILFVLVFVFKVILHEDFSIKNKYIDKLKNFLNKEI